MGDIKRFNNFHYKFMLILILISGIKEEAWCTIDSQETNPLNLTCNGHSVNITLSARSLFVYRENMRKYIEYENEYNLLGAGDIFLNAAALWATGDFDCGDQFFKQFNTSSMDLSAVDKRVLWACEQSKLFMEDERKEILQNMGGANPNIQAKRGCIFQRLLTPQVFDDWYMRDYEVYQDLWRNIFGEALWNSLQKTSFLEKEGTVGKATLPNTDSDVSDDGIDLDDSIRSLIRHSSSFTMSRSVLKNLNTLLASEGIETPQCEVNYNQGSGNYGLYETKELFIKVEDSNCKKGAKKFSEFFCYKHTQEGFRTLRKHYPERPTRPFELPWRVIHDRENSVVALIMRKAGGIFMNTFKPLTYCLSTGEDYNPAMRNGEGLKDWLFSYYSSLGEFIAKGIVPLDINDGAYIFNPQTKKGIWLDAGDWREKDKIKRNQFFGSGRYITFCMPLMQGGQDFLQGSQDCFDATKSTCLNNELSFWIGRLADLLVSNGPHVAHNPTLFAECIYSTCQGFVSGVNKEFLRQGRERVALQDLLPVYEEKNIYPDFKTSRTENIQDLVEVIERLIAQEREKGSKEFDINYIIRMNSDIFIQKLLSFTSFQNPASHLMLAR